MKKSTSLYVRVDREELKRWHRWAKERSLELSHVVRTMFKTGRLPEIRSSFVTSAFIAGSINLRFQLVRAKNSLTQMKSLVEGGRAEGDLDSIEEALSKVERLIERSDELYERLK